MKLCLLFLSVLSFSANISATPTPETAKACAQEMIGRQIGNVSPLGGCALTLATQLRILSRMPHDGSRTEATLENHITEGFISCYPSVPGASAAAGRFISSIREINDVNSTTFGGSSCLGDMWDDIDGILGGANSSGRVVAEPHLTTLDGLNYDFQGEGIFTNFVNYNNDFEVQGLYKKLKPINNKNVLATQAEAFAIKFGKHVINISIYPPYLYIDGVAKDYSNTIILTNGVSISKKLNRFEIRSIENDQISIAMHHTFLDGYFKLSPTRIGSIKGGLLGSFDLDKKNDLTSKDGILIEIKDIKNNPKIYTDFGNSYRVNGIDNLFCDSILSRYNEFDQNFPLSATQDPVSEDQLIIAKKACEKKEITLEPFLQDCIHDFIAVKNDSFSESASLSQKIKTNPETIFRGNDLRDGLNGYYELEFKFIKKNNETIINDLNISTRTDDSAIEYRVDGVAKYRVVTDYFNNKIININLQKETKTGFRINSERILNWEIGLPSVWTKTDKKKIINGLESTLYYFSIPNSKGFAWITNSIKHNHIFPIKYFLGLFRDEKFPTLLFPNNLFGYNEFGMILEAQIDDDNGSRIFTIKNIKKAPDLKMLDLSDVLIKD